MQNMENLYGKNLYTSQWCHVVSLFSVHSCSTKTQLSVREKKKKVAELRYSLLTDRIFLDVLVQTTYSDGRCHLKTGQYSFQVSTKFKQNLKQYSTFAVSMESLFITRAYFFPLRCQSGAGNEG